MIGRERIEQLLAIHHEIGNLWDLRNVDRSTITEEEFYERNLSWWKAKQTIERSHNWKNQVEILTDYLALHEIVEALAAQEPGAFTSGGRPYCTLCGVMLDAEEEHLGSCQYARAVALINPASGARTDSNPIEFEGVGEDPE